MQAGLATDLDLERERRRAANGDDDFAVRDMKEIATAVTGTTRVMTALPGAVPIEALRHE